MKNTHSRRPLFTVNIQYVYKDSSILVLYFRLFNCNSKCLTSDIKFVTYHSSTTCLLFKENMHTRVHLTDLLNEALIKPCDDGTTNWDHEVFIKTLDKSIDSPNASPL